MLVTATIADGHRQRRQGVQCWLLIDPFDSEDARTGEASEPWGIPGMLRGRAMSRVAAPCVLCRTAGQSPLFLSTHSFNLAAKHGPLTVWPWVRTLKAGQLPSSLPRFSLFPDYLKRPVTCGTDHPLR